MSATILFGVFLLLMVAGFLTNRDDAARLRDKDHLQRLSVQIAEGLVRYRDGAPAIARRSDPRARRPRSTPISRSSAPGPGRPT